MKEKLYPEVDYIALGRWYCDHLMAMTAEALHGKADIAAQLAWRDSRLAAKDAEIAELRAAIARQASAVRTLHWAKSEIASGQLRQAHELQQQSKPEALASERDANQQLTDALERAEADRDEARECVGRLFAALLAAGKAHAWCSFGECRSFDHFGNAPILSAADADHVTRQALAATPEHLRS